MKYFDAMASVLHFLLLITVSLSTSCRQSQEEHVASKHLPQVDTATHATILKDQWPGAQKDTVINDTFFLVREFAPDYYHAIFIDKHKRSDRFRALTHFAFDESDAKQYEGFTQAIEASRDKSQKRPRLSGLPENWLPVYPYRGDMYLYAPSDFGSAGKKSITRSEFVVWSMDGPYPIPIESASKVSTRQYSFVLAPMFNRASRSTLNIYILDPKTQLAVFEEVDEPETFRYAFYIPLESASKFDVIDNHCQTQKQPEYEFEKPDFRRLIAGEISIDSL